MKTEINLIQVPIGQRTGLPRFYGVNDSEEKFLKNCETQPADWEYRTKELTYTMNNNGYRTAEWDKIDWANSYLIFGCSHTFGIGIDDSETLAAQIENIIHTPVVNLGVTGGSIQHILANSIELINNGVRPKGVIIFWPAVERTLWWGKEWAIAMGPWLFTPVSKVSPEAKDFYKFWTTNDNAIRQGIVFARACELSWKSCEVPVYTWDLECRNPAPLAKNLLPGWGDDYARDLLHPSARTVKVWAEQIAEQIIKTN